MYCYFGACRELIRSERGVVHRSVGMQRVRGREPSSLKWAISVCKKFGGVLRLRGRDASSLKWPVSVCRNFLGAVAPPLLMEARMGHRGEDSQNILL
jgi:hypothetical protein